MSTLAFSQAVAVKGLLRTVATKSHWLEQTSILLGLAWVHPLQMKADTILQM